jgi:hypothetical protein
MPTRGNTAARIMLGIIAIWSRPDGKIVDAATQHGSSNSHSSTDRRRHSLPGHNGDGHDGCVYLLNFTSANMLDVDVVQFCPFSINGHL